MTLAMTQKTPAGGGNSSACRHLEGESPASSMRVTMGKLALAAGVMISLTSGPVAAAEVTANPAAAKDKISACIGCHAIPGYKSSFPTVYSVPYIAGQSEKYLANALIAYRKGDRDHPTMRAIAGSLTDQDIADLAAYFSQLN